MSRPTQTSLQCSNCGVPNPVVIRRIVDVQNDPQGKMSLLNGQINQFQCQSCGMVNTVSSPLLYHDDSKELLVAFVPMDVAMQQGINEEQMVGQLMNELTASLPKEDFRSYMFNPKRALTMKGLIEQILEADGVTPEMMAEQEQRVALVQDFLQAESEDALIDLIKANDDKIDVSVFQTLTLMAQRLMQTGQQEAVGHLAAIQQVLLENSSYGQEVADRQAAQQQSIEEVAELLETLDENATRSDFIDIAISLADNQDKIEALVGLIRPVFDYEFFMEFTERVNQAPADDRDKLANVRDTIQELTAQLDQQTQMLVQQKAQFLQLLLNSNDYEEMLRDNITAIDDNFMSIITANIQEAERRKDIQTAAKLQQIYQSAVSLLQAQMSPELRFINDLLTTEDEQEMQTLLNEQITNFDGELLEVVDAVGGLLAQQGQQEAIERLSQIREVLATALN